MTSAGVVLTACLNFWDKVATWEMSDQLDKFTLRTQIQTITSRRSSWRWRLIIFYCAFNIKLRFSRFTSIAEEEGRIIIGSLLPSTIWRCNHASFHSRPAITASRKQSTHFKLNVSKTNFVVRRFMSFSHIRHASCVHTWMLQLNFNQMKNCCRSIEATTLRTALRKLTKNLLLLSGAWVLAIVAKLV